MKKKAQTSLLNNFHSITKAAAISCGSLFVLKENLMENKEKSAPKSYIFKIVGLIFSEF